MLVVQGNLAITYRSLGRLQDALDLRQEVYSEYLKLNGEEHLDTLIEAGNYAGSLIDLQRFKEAKSQFLKTIPVARRVLGDGNEVTLGIRCNYASAFYNNPGATLDDLREAVATLGETERTARRVLGGAHPTVKTIEGRLQIAQAMLRFRESPPPS
jgi:chromosome condensin MukBEF MukE localization factor